MQPSTSIGRWEDQAGKQPLILGTLVAISSSVLAINVLVAVQIISPSVVLQPLTSQGNVPRPLHPNLMILILERSP